jgi:hypothetical protein
LERSSIEQNPKQDYCRENINEAELRCAPRQTIESPHSSSFPLHHYTPAAARNADRTCRPRSGNPNNRRSSRPVSDFSHAAISSGEPVIGMERMARHAARLVHDDYRRILVENFEREVGIRLDYAAAIGRGNFDAIVGADDFTFLRAPPVDPHQPALDQLLRHAPRAAKARTQSARDNDQAVLLQRLAR